MGMSYRRYLTGSKIYGCSHCRTHLAALETMVSKAFNGQHGPAYLFDGVVNVLQGDLSERKMTTGLHVVRDIYCVKCNITLGWRYEKAYEEDQKYKEGKSILVLTCSDTKRSPTGKFILERRLIEAV